MISEFKLSRGLFSSYYIAGIFSYFLFELTKEWIISLTTWVINVVETELGYKVNNPSTWLFLFFVCFLITFLIRRYIVYPLGFYINEEGAPTWELIVLGCLVFGSYIYLLNQVFDQPMPSNWPKQLLKLVDGYKNTFSVSQTNQSLVERNTWAIVPWLWTVGPILFMIARTKLSKGKS